MEQARCLDIELVCVTLGINYWIALHHAALDIVLDIRHVKERSEQRTKTICARSWWMLCYWGCQLG